MLIEFRVENHRSICDEQVFTLEVGRLDDPEDQRARRIPGHKARLLPAIAFYGANASGKSNVLSALGFLRDAVVHSHRAWLPDGGIPRDPFAWGPKSTEPSLFEIVMLVQGVRHQYGFTATNGHFVEEWLYAWPRRRKQVWFEREGEQFTFGENLRGENRLVEQVTRSNALFLSAAAQLRHEQLTPVYSWFHRLHSINVLGRSPGLPVHRWLKSTPEPSLESIPIESRLKSLRNLLQAADVGIIDIKVEEEATIDRKAWKWKHPIFVRHQSSAEEAWLPLEEESHGTRTLLEMSPRVLEVLSQGSVLLFDELERSLHPLLALKLLHLFNNRRTNPRNAQLLFSTHDTNLLGTVNGGPPLRRDQIWLTEKNSEGATSLYPLTDYKPRKSENLERGYLQGRYGAIPFLGELANVES